MTREIDKFLNEIGVVAKPPVREPAPRREYPPAWRPAYPGEEPPF